MVSERRRRPSDTELAQTWMAAAWGHCRNGNHAEEMRCRNTARLIQRQPSLTDQARCLVSRKCHTQRG